MTGARRFFGFLILLSVAVVQGGPPASGQTPEKNSLSDPVYVTHVYDGDTIRVKSSDGAVRRVRLIGVDTPERDDRREDERYWAYMATRFVVYRLLDKKVRLGYDWERQDRFGRTLAYVWTDTGELFNERLIREGYSAAFLVYRFREDYRKAFRRAEEDARRAGRGRWQKGEPEVLNVGEAENRLGEYASVRFRCDRVATVRKYFFLWTDDRRFQVLVSKDIVWPKPAAAFFQGREMIVTGILEKQEEVMKVYVSYSRQLSR